MLRLFVIAVALAVLVGLPFLFWGDYLEQGLAGDAAVGWLRDYGPFAWAAGIALLIADIALPVPSSAVMAALGIVYGPWLGGTIATVGVTAAGITGYGLARLFGYPLARRLAGADNLNEGEKLFNRRGGWLVALSRWVPVLAEVVAFMAGLTRMRFPLFVAALVCGAAPLGFLFAAIGDAGEDRPYLVLALSILLPALFWAVARPFVRRHAALD